MTRFISRTGLIIALLALVSIVLGHLGNHELSWVSFQISTYAAKAPYDYFVTTAMLLSAVAILIIGLLSSKYQILGSSHLAHFISPLSGAASFGLLMLAYFEETATSLKMLKQSGFMAIRIQTFHDAGLLIFFYSSLLLVGLMGILTMILGKNKFNMMLGGIIACLSPASFILMTTKWPKYIGFDGVTTGLNQRAALLCLWFAFIIILLLATRKNNNRVHGTD